MQENTSVEALIKQNKRYNNWNSGVTYITLNTGHWKHWAYKHKENKRGRTETGGE